MTAIVTGWGTLSSGGDSPNILQEVEVDTMSNADCKGWVHLLSLNSKL